MNILPPTACNLKVNGPQNQFLGKKSLLEEKLTKFLFANAISGNLDFHFTGPKIKIFNNDPKFLKAPDFSTFEYNNWSKYHWIWLTNLQSTAHYVRYVKKLDFHKFGPLAGWPSPNGPDGQSYLQSQFIWVLGTTQDHKHGGWSPNPHPDFVKPMRICHLSACFEILGLHYQKFCKEK